jgi:hypothetical protein
MPAPQNIPGQQAAGNNNQVITKYIISFPFLNLFIFLRFQQGNQAQQAAPNVPVGAAAYGGGVLYGQMPGQIQQQQQPNGVIRNLLIMI